MKRGFIAAIILILLLIGLVIWMYRSALSRDTGIAPSDEMSEELSNALEGRVLVWSTDANVPLGFVVGKDYGSGILRSLGVPKYLRPNDFDIWRRPVRFEVNLASVLISDGLSDAVPHYFTSDQGGIFNPNVSADGNFIVAEHAVDQTYNIVRFDINDGQVSLVAFSPSIDQWPSCDHDGSKILFKSYRDNNPGGDLYLAVEDENATDGWRIVRLTDRPDVGYLWPKISGDGNWCVAVEVGPPYGSYGRVVMWPLAGEELGDSKHLTEIEDVKFPSLDSSARKCCWIDSDKYIILWTVSEDGHGGGSIRVINTDPDAASGYYYIDQAALTADGNFIIFFDYHYELGESRIGIYDFSNDSTFYLEGHGALMMFPSMSNQVGSDDVQ